MSRVRVQSSAPVPEWQQPVIVAPLTQAFPQFEQIKEFRSKVCIFNHDRTRVFDVVSDRYEVVDHGKAIQRVQDALGAHFGASAPTFNVRSLNGGARIRAEVRLPMAEITLGLTDVSHLTLILRNSYDRSCSFSARLGAFRKVCSNGAMIGETFGAITSRHLVKSENEGDTILDQLGTIIHRAPMVRQLWEQWQSEKISLDDAGAMLDGWLPAKYATPILEPSRWKRHGCARTMWEFYNDLTHMSTHLTGSVARRMEFDEKIATLFYADAALSF